MSDEFQSVGNGTGPNPARQEGPHAHQILTDLDAKHVFGVDLGADKVNALDLDLATGTFSPNEVPFAPVASGSGPRHMAFHPDRKHAYVLDELVSSITVFNYESERGAFIWAQTIPTLPKGFNGTNTTAEIRIHPSGRFLYNTNRGHNSVTMYEIDQGTGMFKERKPDQYVQLVRYDGYSARKEPASGYAGRREAWIDELRFIPVPNANTRVEGSLSGQYQFADLLPVESYSRLENSPNVKPVLTSPFGFPYLVLNTKQGPLANLALRQAVEAALNNADMYSGRVVEEADVHSLFKRPRHPYTRGLLECLPRRALDDESTMARRRLNAIPGQVASPLDPQPGCAFAPRCALVLHECSDAMPPLAALAAGQRSRCIRWEML